MAITSRWFYTVIGQNKYQCLSSSVEQLCKHVSGYLASCSNLESSDNVSVPNSEDYLYMQTHSQSDYHTHTQSRTCTSTHTLTPNCKHTCEDAPFWLENNHTHKAFNAELNLYMRAVLKELQVCLKLVCDDSDNASVNTDSAAHIHSQMSTHTHTEIGGGTDAQTHTNNQNTCITDSHIHTLADAFIRDTHFIEVLISALPIMSPSNHNCVILACDLMLQYPVYTEGYIHRHMHTETPTLTQQQKHPHPHPHPTHKSNTSTCIHTQPLVKFFIHTHKVLHTLVRGCLCGCTALVCVSILRLLCSQAAHQNGVQLLHTLLYTERLSYIHTLCVCTETAAFDVSVSVMSLLRESLTTRPEIGVMYLWNEYELFYTSIHNLLRHTNTYLCKRLTLELIVDLFLCEQFKDVKFRYITDAHNLQRILDIVAVPEINRVTLTGMKLMRMFITNRNKSMCVNRLLQRESENIKKYCRRLLRGLQESNPVIEDINAIKSYMEKIEFSPEPRRAMSSDNI